MFPPYYVYPWGLVIQNFPPRVIYRRPIEYTPPQDGIILLMWYYMQNEVYYVD